MIYKLNLLTRFLIFSFIIFTFSCIKKNKRFICNSGYEITFEEYDYNNINKEWLKEDIDFYNSLKQICSKKPSRIQELFSVNKKNDVDLGNGFFSNNGSYGKGYLNVFYNLVFKEDSLIAYSLNMSLKNILLLEKYKYKPQEVFKKTKGVYTKYDEYLFYYGYENVSIPYDNTIKIRNNISPEMRFYMTPFSGIKYGCKGGYGNGMLGNRCAFKKMEYEQDLTSQDLIYIMHSINLASRLTAIEYYTRNINKFNNKEQKEIEKIAANVFSKFGDKKTTILSDDIGYPLTIEDAINRELENNCN